MADDTTAATSTATAAETQAATDAAATAAAAATTAAVAAAATAQETQQAQETAAAAAATAAAATTAATAAAAAAAVAPEKYELALPAGGVLEQTDLDAVAALAKTKGWSNEQAQAAVEELQTSLVAQKQAFRTELDAHPEIGGQKFAVAQEHALRALDRFLPATSPEGQQFRSALNKSGYGEYAPMVLLLSRIGKAMSEDRALPNAQGLGGGARRSAADVLFGDIAKPSTSS